MIESIIKSIADENGFKIDMQWTVVYKIIILKNRRGHKLEIKLDNDTITLRCAWSLDNNVMLLDKEITKSINIYNDKRIGELPQLIKDIFYEIENMKIRFIGVIDNVSN